MILSIKEDLSAKEVNIECVGQARTQVIVQTDKGRHVHKGFEVGGVIFYN